VSFLVELQELAKPFRASQRCLLYFAGGAGRRIGSPKQHEGTRPGANGLAVCMKREPAPGSRRPGDQRRTANVRHFRNWCRTGELVQPSGVTCIQMAKARPRSGAVIAGLYRNGPPGPRAGFPGIVRGNFIMRRVSIFRFRANGGMGAAITEHEGRRARVLRIVLPVGHLAPWGRGWGNGKTSTGSRLGTRFD